MDSFFNSVLLHASPTIAITALCLHKIASLAIAWLALRKRHEQLESVNIGLIQLSLTYKDIQNNGQSAPRPKLDDRCQASNP